MRNELLEELQPYTALSVPDGGVTDLAVCELDLDKELNASLLTGTSIASIFPLGAILQLLVFHGIPPNPVAICVLMLGGFTIGTLSNIMPVWRAAKKLKKMRAELADSAVAETLLRKAVKAWNRQHRLLHEDAAALTAESTPQERRLLHERALLLRASREKIDERIALLRQIRHWIPLEKPSITGTGSDDGKRTATIPTMPPLTVRLD